MKKLPPHKKPESIPLTQEAYDQAKKQLKQYKQEREEILVRLQAAREMGDLSENGAYKYAKFELGNINRKLKQAKLLVRHGVVQQANTDGVAEFGNQVTLANDQGELSFTLVSRHESNPGQRKLSTDSPFGQAVVGKRVGDQVVVQAPAGEKKYILKSVD